MSFFFAMLLWAIMAAVLITGVVMLVHGSALLLGIGFLVFVAGVIKEGILPH
jgi:hypothetical protein